MSRFISITSGSKPILNYIIKKHPNHDLKLYKSTTENTLTLIDWFTSQSIFKSPFNYQIVQSSSDIKIGPFIHFIYFTIDRKGQKPLTAYVKRQLNSSTYPLNMTSLFELRNKKNPYKIIIGSSWSSNENYLRWFKKSFIHRFVDDPNTSEFHNNLVLLK